MKRYCLAILWILCVSAGACNSEPSPPNKSGSSETKPARVEIIEAPKEEDIAALVRSEMAKAPDRPLLVYVGAPWCEPCTRFHRAAAAGELDSMLGGLRLLEFDFDRDHEALSRVGYTSKLIPLFAVPNADGTASGQAVSGGIKGEGAVSELWPRVSELLARYPR